MTFSRLSSGLLVGIAALLILGPVTAGVAEDLTALRAVVNGQITGGALDAKQLKAADKVLTAIDKAEAVATEPKKYHKKVAKVLARTDQAEKKGVDLGTAPADLLSSMILDVEDVRAQAVRFRDTLVVDKNARKIANLVAKGDTKVLKAEAKETSGKKAKTYAGAGGQFQKGVEQGVKLRQKEIDSGVVTLEVTGHSLESNPQLMLGQKIEVAFSLEIDAGSAVFPQVELVDSQGNPASFTTEPSTDGDQKKVLISPDVPPDPAQYTLIIHGLDTQAGVIFESIGGVPLNETLSVTFSLVP